MSEHILTCPYVQLAYRILKVPTKKKTIFTIVSAHAIGYCSNIKLIFFVIPPRCSVQTYFGT